MIPQEVVAYHPLTRRRRWQVLLLAVATGVGAVLLLTDTPGRQPVPPAQRAAPPVCADGRGSGCVGGMATVLMTPAASASASAAAAAALK